MFQGAKKGDPYLTRGGRTVYFQNHHDNGFVRVSDEKSGNGFYHVRSTGNWCDGVKLNDDVVKKLNNNIQS